MFAYFILYISGLYNIAYSSYIYNAVFSQQNHIKAE